MIIGNIYCLSLIMAFFTLESTADVSVKINIYPKLLKPGGNLMVQCSIFNKTPSDRLRTFLYCPFIENGDYCYADCVDICQHVSCGVKDKFLKTMKCSSNENENSIVFSYEIFNISQQQINNRNTLPFSCKFKGFEVRDNVTVIENLEFSTKSENSYSTITTDTTVPNIQKSSTPKDTLLLLFDLDVRNIILIVLISSLITSFFINVWCCVQCCARQAKIKRRKKKEKLKNKSQSNLNIQMSNERLLLETSNQQSQGEHVYPQTYYNTDDFIRRAKSQPALVNDGKSNPVKLSTSNLNKLRPGSMNNNVKYRSSICNTSLNDFYHNGSIPEYINPLSGQPIIGYPYPQYIPIPNYVYSHHPNDRFNASQSEDLDTLDEQVTPERRQSSIVQPLPSKPEDCLSNIESASSSHIV